MSGSRKQMLSSIHPMKHAISITTGSFATARGFTIIELMVTLAVAGMLTAMAVPAFNNFVLNDRDIGQINSLVASFNYARSEAIKLNSGGVQVCTSVDGLSCNGGSNWNGGWIVKETLPNAPSATVVQYVPAFAGANTVKVGGPTMTEDDVLVDRHGGCVAHRPDVRQPRRRLFA